MIDLPVTHQARIVLTRALNERVVFDVKIRKLGELDELSSIMVRMTLSEAGLRKDVGHPNCWKYSIRDHRYLLAKVRDALVEAAEGAWLDLAVQSIQPPTSIADLRDH